MQSFILFCWTVNAAYVGSQHISKWKWTEAVSSSIYQLQTPKNRIAYLDSKSHHEKQRFSTSALHLDTTPGEIGHKSYKQEWGRWKIQAGEQVQIRENQEQVLMGWYEYWLGHRWADRCGSHVTGRVEKYEGIWWTGRGRIVTVKALVCLTWPGCDWRILSFTESVCYCHLLCCLSVCPPWYDFDCWACTKMMWEMEKHVGGRILNRIDEAKVYLAANWMCSSAVAAFKNIPHDVLFYYLGHKCFICNVYSSEFL